MWTPPLWSPPVALSPAEQKVAARAATRKKLFVFLRESRGELFDDAFQDELLEMYRQTGAGKPPVGHRRCWRWRRCCKPIPGSAIRRRWN